MLPSMQQRWFCVLMWPCYVDLAPQAVMVDSASTRLNGGHATRLQFVEPSTASLAEQNKRLYIPLDSYKAHVMLLEQNCLMQSVQRRTALFFKLSAQLHLALFNAARIIVCAAHFEAMQTIAKRPLSLSDMWSNRTHVSR